MTIERDQSYISKVCCRILKIVRTVAVLLFFEKTDVFCTLSHTQQPYSVVKSANTAFYGLAIIHPGLSPTFLRVHLYWPDRFSILILQMPKFSDLYYGVIKMLFNHHTATLCKVNSYSSHALSFIRSCHYFCSRLSCNLSKTPSTEFTALVRLQHLLSLAVISIQPLTWPATFGEVLETIILVFTPEVVTKARGMCCRVAGLVCCNWILALIFTSM